MTDRYARLDVLLFHKATCDHLYRRFGHFGPLAWVALILAAKRHHPAGELTWTSSTSAWEELFGPNVAASAPVTFDEFIAYLGQLKQIRKTRNTPSTHVQHAVITQYGRWQKESRRYEERVRKSSKRAQNAADTQRTPRRTRSGHETGPRTRTRTTPQTPHGMNGKPSDRCPICNVQMMPGRTIAEHLENVHPEHAGATP